MGKSTMSKLLWGGAISSAQYDGGYPKFRAMDTQDCRAYIPRTSNATTETRLLTRETVMYAKEDPKHHLYPFRSGSNGLEHLEEDLKLIQELGLTVFRFSISWSFLLPDLKTLNPHAVEYYTKLIQGLKKANIKVFVMLNHYAIPLDLVLSIGGWKNRDMVDCYLFMVDQVFRLWGEDIDYFIPINEINTGYFSPYNGTGLMKEKDQEYCLTDVFKSLHHQFVASAKAISLAKRYNLQAKSGAMVACFSYYPYTCKPIDNLLKLQKENLHQWFCMDVLARGYYPSYMLKHFQQESIDFEMLEDDLQCLQENTCDFVSFSYYQSGAISSGEEEKTTGNLVLNTKNPYLEATEWGWQIDPIGLRISINQFYDRYQKPVFIVENGLGYNDCLTEDLKVHDDYRVCYLQEHFKQIELAAELDGVPVLGYIMWGIIDIVSAGSCEMSKRYGVVYVDADNHCKGSYKRYKKDSFNWYKKFIQSKE